MKILIGLLMVLSSVTFARERAEVVGRGYFDVRLTNGRGEWESELRQEGTKILGQSSFSRWQIVNLETAGGHYKGAANGNVDLKCVNNMCSGQIAGASTQFSIYDLGGGAFHIKGNMNFSRLDMVINSEEIKLNSYGFMSLKRSEERRAQGYYKGQGNLGTLPGLQAYVDWHVNGTFVELDPVLAVIFLARPFAGR